MAAMPLTLFLTWEAWLDRQWNLPNRTDHYLMQCALMQCKDGTKMSDMRLKFRDSSEQKHKPATLDEAMQTKSLFLGMFGIRPGTEENEDGDQTVAE